MLSADARRRLAVILVGARNPQNIGAAARAMQDFGFSDLRVVNPFGAPFDAAQLEATSAVGAAADVMRSAQRFDALPDAVADCTLVAGTTAIGGRGLRQPVVSLTEAAPQLLAALSGELAPPDRIVGSADDIDPGVRNDGRNKVALLFGSEKTGLTNEQLSFCSLLLTIPLFAPGGRHLSMNLGQAVAVCLYELSRGGFEGARTLPVLREVPATGSDRERLTMLLQDAMLRSGYARRFPANARPEVMRQLAGKLAGTREEAATWMGFLKMTLRALQGQSDPEI